MTNKVATFGSLRNRLVFTLIGGAAVLALLFFFAVRSFSIQIAQQGQDNILFASATSMLDAAAIRNGAIELDLPYSAFSMLSTQADDRVFYAVLQDGKFLSGYEDLVVTGTFPGNTPTYKTNSVRGAAVRIVSASRTLIGANERTDVQIILAQTQDALSKTLDQISKNAALLGVGFFALTSALAFWATSATIGQLGSLTKSVTRRGPQDLRPFQRAVPKEMGPLVNSLNSLMGRLDQSLSQSEDFIAEAAH